jgi:hypothetical protein
MMDEELNGGPVEEQEEETPDEGGTETPKGGEVEFSEEQQKALDRIIKDRLARAKDKWQQDAEAERRRAEEKAEQDRLEAQKEFEALAQKRAEKISELEGQLAESEGLQERVGEYEKTVEGMLTAMLQELGKEARAAVDALPGEPDVLAKLAWLKANEGLFGKDKGAGLGTPARRQRARVEETESDGRRRRSTVRL